MAMNKVLGTYKPDNLFAANQELPAVADALDIAAGQDLKRGCLITSAGAACGASDEPYAVLAEDVKTGEGETKSAAVYLTGEFNIDAISVAEGAEVANLKIAARKVGIFLKKNI